MDLFAQFAIEGGMTEILVISSKSSGEIFSSEKKFETISVLKQIYQNRITFCPFPFIEKDSTKVVDDL